MPLLVLRLLLVDDTEDAFAANQDIIGTDFFDTGTNFHELLDTSRLLLIPEPEADSALCEIVGGQLNFYSIARYKPDIVLAHLSRNVGDNAMAILEFYLKLRVRQCFHHLTLQLDYFLLTSHR